jgi:hypothetical protein
LYIYAIKLRCLPGAIDEAYRGSPTWCAEEN